MESCKDEEIIAQGKAAAAAALGKRLYAPHDL
jgi:hypothetical protein